MQQPALRSRQQGFILNPYRFSHTSEDPYYNNVSLLLKPKGDDGSTVFMDSGPKGKTVNTGESAKVSTTQGLFGDPTTYFDGAGYLSVGTDIDFEFGDQDFTVEAWVYPTNASAGITISGNSYQSILNQSALGVVSSGAISINLMNLRPIATLFYNQSSNPGYVESSTAIPLNAWALIEYSRSGSMCYLFANGELLGTASVSVPTDVSNYPVCIGSDSVGAGKFHGYMAGVRVTKGICRHTSTYTPTTVSFPE